MDALVDSVRAEMSSILQEYEREGQLTACTERGLQVLTTAGLAHRMRLHCQHVGFHKLNRDSYGINPRDVHDLVADIRSTGFSWKKCEGALASEVRPNDTTPEEVNNTLVSVAGGLLPSVDPGSLKVCSLTKGHTNQGLRCAWYGVKCTHASLSVDGRMSKDKIAQADEAFGDAINNGLHWLVLSWRVEAEWPEFIEMCMQEGNASAQMQRDEHELQVLLRIHKLAKEYQEQGRDIDWDYIMKLVVRSKPPCRDYVAQLCKYIEHVAGGLDAHVCARPRAVSQNALRLGHSA